MKLPILLVTVFAITIQAQAMSPEQIAKITKTAARFSKDCSPGQPVERIQDIQVINKTAESIDKDKFASGFLETLKISRDAASKGTLEVVIKSTSSEDGKTRSTAYVLKIALSEGSIKKCVEAYPALLIETK